MHRRRGAPVLAAFVLAACANPNVARLNDPQATARSVTAQEKEWIAEGDAFEKKLEEKNAFLVDAGAQAYLDAMTARLLEAAGASGAPLRVRVLRPSIFNVVVLANGMVGIDVLYFSLLEDGAQLAAILGHEIEHHLDRHRLRSERERRNQRTISFVAMVPLVALGLGEIGLQAADEMAAGMAGRYSREQEMDADRSGLRMALAAGYDVRSAPRIFENMMGLEEEGKKEKVEVRPADRTHPETPERLALMREAVAALQGEGADFAATTADRSGFEMALAPFFLEDARSYLDRHWLGRAAALVERYLAVRPLNAEGWFMKAEVARLSAAGESARASGSAAAYRRATELDPKMAKAWRGLGLALRDQGREADAHDPLRRYLALDHDAVDRPIVEAWLVE